MTSSTSVLTVAVWSWILVDSARSRRPNSLATTTSIGSSTRMSRQSCQFMANRKPAPPMKVTICLAASMGVSVTTFWITVTSFMRRDINSPVRRFEKKLTDSVSRCAKRWIRKSAITRWETQAVR